MKSIIVLLILLTCVQEIPDGIWIQKEDSSKFEIFEREGMLYGRVLSSKNPQVKPGSYILREVKYENGVGNGEMYNFKKARWEAVKIESQDKILFIEIKFGFLVNNIKWYKDSI